MQQIKQTGSAHAIIIVVLVIALLGALGVVFYQNFIGKDSSVKPSISQQTPQTSLQTIRVAFQSSIYALDYPDGWTALTEPGAGGASTTLFTNADKTIRAKVVISGGGLGGSCDTASSRKVRFYTVSSNAIAKLNGSKAYMVESMTDAEGSGYDYKIGLTQDGGDTHAAVGDSFCTVSHVGVASQLVLGTEPNTITHPTVMATIDFPKMAAGTDVRVKEMQQVKDMLGIDDYKASVKILESIRKE